MPVAQSREPFSPRLPPLPSCLLRSNSIFKLIFPARRRARVCAFPTAIAITLA